MSPLEKHIINSLPDLSEEAKQLARDILGAGKVKKPKTKHVVDIDVLKAKMIKNFNLV